MNNVAKKPLSGNGAIAPRPAAWSRGTIFCNGLINRSDVPSCRSHFRGLFMDWVSTRFYESRQSGADIFPEAGTRAAQIQDLADTAALGQKFDLNDPSVAPLWIEYLTENPTRADWWRRFLKLNGSCEVL